MDCAVMKRPMMEETYACEYLHMIRTFFFELNSFISPISCAIQHKV